MSARSAPESPASFVSRERAALAAGIARHAQLAAHLADTRHRARAGSEAALSSALRDRDAAEAALREAEDLASHHALARALGHAAGPTAQQARADLDAARARFDAAWSDSELVKSEIDRLARAVDIARVARDAGVAAVLSAAPGFAALVASLPLARQRVQQLENLFAELGKLPGVALPPHWDTPLLRSRPDDWAPDAEAAALWRDAISALQTNPAAPLPGGDPPAPQAEAA
jgi:hypothetical protein